MGRAGWVRGSGGLAAWVGGGGRWAGWADVKPDCVVGGGLEVNSLGRGEGWVGRVARFGARLSGLGGLVAGVRWLGWARCSGGGGVSP